MISFDQLVKDNPDLTITIVERYWYYLDRDLTEFSNTQLQPHIKYITYLPDNRSTEFLAKCLINDQPYMLLVTSNTIEIVDSAPARWSYRMLSVAKQL